MKNEPNAPALRVLWVDDDEELIQDLAAYFSRQGYDVQCAQNLAEAKSKLADTSYDLALIDLDLPDGDGLSLIRSTPPERVREFAVITGHGSVRTAVEALRHQVFDYLMKPLELAELSNLLARVAHNQPAAAKPGLKARQDPPRSAADLLPGRAAAMQSVHKLISRAAASNTTILLQGESGTGKELAAQCLHQLSHRASGPFLAFNCATFSPSLIASELFGHEKGSFTGATGLHKGIFERAEGGTLLLDEITEMPLELQASLLRVLEAGTVVRVGGSRELPVDVRIIAATNRDPARLVEEGRFRFDLYYRLQVFPIALPPLRERIEDIPLLAELFLAQFAGPRGTPRRLSDTAIRHLQHHTWPGNVRELRNVIERACLLGGSLIEPEHLLLSDPAGTALARGSGPPGAAQSAAGTLRDMEQEAILQALADTGGNKTRAAAQLGISLKTLYNKLKRFDPSTIRSNGRPETDRNS